MRLTTDTDDIERELTALAESVLSGVAFTNRSRLYSWLSQLAQWCAEQAPALWTELLTRVSEEDIRLWVKGLPALPATTKRLSAQPLARLNPRIEVGLKAVATNALDEIAPWHRPLSSIEQVRVRTEIDAQRSHTQKLVTLLQGLNAWPSSWPTLEHDMALELCSAYVAQLKLSRRKIQDILELGSVHGKDGTIPAATKHDLYAYFERAFLLLKPAHGEAWRNYADPAMNLKDPSCRAKLQATASKRAHRIEAELLSLEHSFHLGIAARNREEKGA